MKRELSYREEMVQQLHIVRGETHKAEESQTPTYLAKISPFRLLLITTTTIIMIIIIIIIMIITIIIIRPNRLKAHYYN